MSGLDFTASLVHSLAWPAAVAFVAFLLRRAIRAALEGNLRRLRVGPVEAEWAASVAEVVEQLPTPAGGLPISGLAEELAPIATRAPRVAVLEAFDRIAAELRAIAERHGMSAKLREKLC